MNKSESLDDKSTIVNYNTYNNLCRCSAIIKEIRNAFVTEAENVACFP